MNRFKFTALLTLFALVLFISCDDDSSSSPPTTGTLNGQVVFHGDWPDSGTVQLSIFTNWNNEGTNCYWCAMSAGGPPAYYTHSNYFQDPDPTNLSDADTLAFEITGISLGDYEVVVAGWRNPTPYSDVECDEPVIGMYGADPATTDTIPSSISFTDGSPEQTILFHAYFDRIPDCEPVTNGTISGTVVTEDAWPEGGFVALLSTQPVTGWTPPTSAPAGYAYVLTETENTFEFTPALGSYTVSIWYGGHGNSQWCGSYGVNTSAPAYDAIPDFITLDETNHDVSGLQINVNVPPPHYLAGDVTFNGTRPAEGILTLLSTFPYTPEHQPTGQPSGYFAITDETQTRYAFNNIPAGTYYVSLWSNTPPPGTPTFFGAYGYTAGSDTDPDPVTLDETTEGWGAFGINIIGNAP